MATYIHLVNWTDQGVRDYAGTVERADQVGELARAFGGSMTTLYWTLGSHDLVAISEFEDDEVATAFALAVSAGGNVRTSTLRAFDADQMRAILQRIDETAAAGG